MSRKYIGTIIDRSYYYPYNKIDKYGNIHTYKICRICEEIIDVGFRKNENSGFACALPHLCETFKRLAAIEKIHIQLTDVNKFSPELEWGQFMFIKPKILSPVQSI